MAAKRGTGLGVISSPDGPTVLVTGKGQREVSIPPALRILWEYRRLILRASVTAAVLTAVLRLARLRRGGRQAPYSDRVQ